MGKGWDLEAQANPSVVRGSPLAKQRLLKQPGIQPKPLLRDKLEQIRSQVAAHQ
jgi:hypothetical protein